MSALGSFLMPIGFFIAIIGVILATNSPFMRESLEQSEFLKTHRRVVGVLLGIPAGRIIDRLSKRMVAGCCMILDACLAFLFLRVGTYTEVLALALVAAVVDSFLNPSLKSIVADLIPRSVRGRAMALVGGGGLNLMRNVQASGILSKTFLTIGAFMSGYIYSVDNSLPWLILSMALLVIGVLFILIVKDPAKPEV